MVKNFSENGVIIPENIMKKEADIESVAVACANMYQDVVLWQKESFFHSISICENLVGRFMKYGISFQAGKIDSDTYKGNIPYLNYFLLTKLLNPNPKKFLLIGFGIGLLAMQLNQIFSNIEKFDAVDIEENILQIATEFFDFKPFENFEFHLQDALVYLRNNKTKYDLIIVDVAGNEGIDERFFEDEFFVNIKKSLKKNGIFAFNSCSNIDFQETENDFFGFTVNQFKKYFKNFAVFDALTSDSLYYKIFFDINSRAIDVTNAIFLASDKLIKKNNFENISKEDLNAFEAVGVDINPYIKDLHKIYSI